MLVMWPGKSNNVAIVAVGGDGHLLLTVPKSARVVYVAAHILLGMNKIETRV